MFGSAALSNETVQNLHDVFASKALPDLDCQRLTAEYVDNGQGPKLFAVAELVVNEVEAPGFVQLLRSMSSR
jgi:hypothetical protein